MHFTDLKEVRCSQRQESTEKFSKLKYRNSNHSKQQKTVGHLNLGFRDGDALTLFSKTNTQVEQLYL